MYRKRSRVAPVLVVGAIIAAIALGVGARQWWKMYASQPAPDAEKVAVTIDEGRSVASVAEELEERGVIASAFWFRVTAKLDDGLGAIQPGVFEIEQGSSYQSILLILGDEPETDEVTLTIPEGFSLAQMGERVREKFPHITADEWARVTGVNSPFASHSFVEKAQKPDSVDLEGYLFPDTYRFFHDATAEDIVKIMIDTMEARVTEAGLAARAELPTLHDALTLASIVEKEVRQQTTMANVADVFLKRLAINMALQSDATINYIIGGDDPSPTYADLEVESPYNTYKHPGLPPGPISSPGLNALKAVADPIENAYFYFLTTDSGEIYYAATYDEHNANKYKYLK